MAMIHVTLESENGVDKTYFLPASTVVASPKLWLHLDVIAVEYFCSMSHLGIWFIAGEDGGRRKIYLKCGPDPSVCTALCCQGVYGIGQCRQSVSHCWQLLMVSHNWISWNCLIFLFPPRQLQICQHWCLSPASSVKAEDINSHLKEEATEPCFLGLL